MLLGPAHSGPFFFACEELRALGGADFSGRLASAVTRSIAPLHAARDPLTSIALRDPNNPPKCQKRQSQSAISRCCALGNSMSLGPIGLFLVIGEKVGIDNFRHCAPSAVWLLTMHDKITTARAVSAKTRCNRFTYLIALT